MSFDSAFMFMWFFCLVLFIHWIGSFHIMIAVIYEMFDSLIYWANIECIDQVRSFGQELWCKMNLKCPSAPFHLVLIFSFLFLVFSPNNFFTELHHLNHFLEIFSCIDYSKYYEKVHRWRVTRVCLRECFVIKLNKVCFLAWVEIRALVRKRKKDKEKKKQNNEIV